MIGLDTHVLARYFVAEENSDAATQRQRQAARRLIESGEHLRVAKTVLLELEWLLRGRYAFTPAEIAGVFDHLLAQPQVVIEARAQVLAALAGFRQGLDFADALHHASYRDCTRMASFDERRFTRRAKRMGLIPSVSIPA